MEKVIKADDCSCPSCGATMRYCPEKRKLLCDSCQTCKDIEFVPLKTKHLWSEKDTLTNLADFTSQTNALKCPNCGANVILNKLEYSKVCPYCFSSLVSSSAINARLAPDGILPFTFSNEVASQKYVAGIKKKWFVPNAFKKAPPTENIKGVYVPAFGYDAKTFTTYAGKLATQRTYRDANGNTRTQVTYRNISGNLNSMQLDVLVETSSKINQKQLEEIKPYNVTQAVTFKQAFIMGYTVEAYENTLEECKKIADDIMYNNVKDEILSRYTYDWIEYFNMDLKKSDEKFMYYLLPVYKCDYKFKNKNYTTIMNGQTGRVGGGYPKSPVKITFFTLFWVLLLISIIFLCVFFGD